MRQTTTAEVRLVSPQAPVSPGFIIHSEDMEQLWIIHLEDAGRVGDACHLWLNERKLSVLDYPAVRPRPSGKCRLKECPIEPF
jgi:hypothetical protein